MIRHLIPRIGITRGAGPTLTEDRSIAFEAAHSAGSLHMTDFYRGAEAIEPWLGLDVPF